MNTFFINCSYSRHDKHCITMEYYNSIKQLNTHKLIRNNDCSHKHIRHQQLSMKMAVFTLTLAQTYLSKIYNLLHIKKIKNNILQESLNITIPC